MNITTNRMNIKLIVSDVDGTFLPKSRTITDATRKMLIELAKRNIAVVLASSRPPLGMRHILEDAGMMRTPTPFIGMNGAIIASTNGETLHSATLESSIVQAIYEAVSDTGVNFMLLDETGWWSSGNDELVRREAASLRFEPILSGLQERMKSPVSKITLLGKPEDSAEAKRRIDTLFAGKISASSPANPKFIDITALGVHKGTAVLGLAAILGVKSEEICTIGDGDNDTEMFWVSGMSVAMGHASESVRAAATHLTASCEDDGWAKAMQNFVLQNNA
jgi:Cof subfamily protein (haloacid dehalogenase superfamily)